MGKEIADRVVVIKNVINDYYPWLLDLIVPNPNNHDYFLLIKDLFKKDFKWYVPNDDNRAFEAKNLRERFCDDHGLFYEYEYEHFNPEISILELLIGLSYRCESIMADSEQNENMTMRDWFWKLISNARLDEFTDQEYYVLNGRLVVDNILDKIINRTYHRNGVGGLFPLKHYKKDQRKIELWYQMSNYLVENYYTEV